MADIPYANATSDGKAREETARMLQRLGCAAVGFMDDYVEKRVQLVFKHRGRQMCLHASSAGWAAMFLKANPWTPRRRYTKEQWETRALNQGGIAVSSILRDWVKGQVMAIETGVMSFEQAFLPYMLTKHGKTVGELLEANPSLLQIEGPADAKD
ncbi:MAG: hypothetical protein OXC11_02350 [Rhodospirillales bacterium]|nr:hypothetical protein [Rhodospirillales bacterium]